MRNLLSGSLIILGLVSMILSGTLLWQRNSPSRLAFALEETQTVPYLHLNPPKTFVIRDLGIDLPVYSATINNGKWKASPDGVSYLSSSPLPGDRGNSIIYGHNWESILGKLTKAQPGQEIEITFEDGTTKTFVIEYTSVVTPDQTHILNPTDDYRITVYTCIGFLDTKRFVVVAFPH